MKILLPFIYIILLPIFGYSQITTPVIKANFGVDGDLRANFFNGAILGGNDDWYRNSGTGGEGIIDTTGASFILNKYATDPNFRKLPFFRGMSFPQFSVINNRLLIDGIFMRDYHGDDSTVFGSGSSKNGMSPAIWNCPPSQSVPDKNQILDIFMHVRRAGPGGTDSLWLFGGVSIENTTGSRYFDFEMYQTDIFYDRSTQKFSGYGPDAGHTSWQFDAMGNVTRPGDIIFTAEFGTAALNLVEARIWINNASLSLTPGTFNWGGQFDGDGNGATYGYANILPKSTGDFYTGLVNASNTWAGPFQLVRDDNSVVTDYITQQFMEFSVNLTKLGLDPYLTSGDICGLPFRKILIKSRSSTSFTSELKDFVGPFDFFRAPRANAAAMIPVFCGATGITDINITNALPTSVYKWSTLDGNIVTGSVGPSITVDKPGTYIVRQELMNGCSSAYAFDTVVVLADLLCFPLKTNIIDFTAQRDGVNIHLKWTTTANQSASYFQVERSKDNQQFTPVGVVARQGEGETSNYSFDDQVQDLDNTVFYYRIRIVDINGNMSFSKIITVSTGRNESLRVAITPNPVQHQAHLVFTSDHEANVQVVIYNNSGKIVHSLRNHINRGASMIIVDGILQWPKGIYMVRTLIGDRVYTQKMIVTN